MKSKIVLATLVLMCLIGSISVASAGKETQLTDGQRLTVSTSIYGNLVTWHETFTNGVHVYDLTARKEIGTGTTGSADSNINVYGNTVVWSDPGNEVLMYDISTGKETQIASGGYYPDIYGNYIVYDSGQRDSIYLYDLKTDKKTQIAPTASEYTYSPPAIYGNKVVWSQKSSDNAYDVYIFDISSRQRSKIATSGLASEPDIHGNVVVWSGSNNGKYNVYMRDIAAHKITQVTTSGTATDPAIYGNRIVYTNLYSIGGSDIYMYEISTAKTSRITTSTSALGPSVYGNKIVYADSRNDPEYGEIKEIFIYDLAAKLAKPAAAFTANKVSGTHPLRVTFTYTGNGGTPDSYLWNFGDKTTSTHALTATHTYSKAGTYTVCVTVQNKAGSSTSTKNKYITVK
jgi:beta propeller repeat protein